MITYIFLLVALTGHLILDIHKKATNSIVHWLSASVVIIISVLVGILNSARTDTYFWQFAIYSLAAHFCFFDPIWNLINKEKWYYNGSPDNPHRAWSDKIYDYIPVYAQPLLRLWVLGVGAGIYYHLNWVIGQ